MKRRWIIAAVVVIALVAVFGGGCCVVLTKHRCSERGREEAAELTPDPFTANGIKHDVYTFGSGGPDIVLLHELPGLTVETVRLANNLRDLGYTVHVPLIFGEFGKYSTAKGFAKCATELNCFGTGDSRFGGWLKEYMAAKLPNHPVVVIGMCLTGSVALEVADAPDVAAVVMAQPSLPLPLTPWQRPKIGITDDHAKRIKTPILAMRFSEDCLATRERFATLRATFPPTQIEFEEVDSHPGNPGKFCKEAHATLTSDFSKQAYAHLETFLARHAKPAILK